MQFTHAQVNAAMHAAANHIEANPSAFSFTAGGIPMSRDSCGCALAWIGHFLIVDGRTVHELHDLCYSYAIPLHHQWVAEVIGWSEHGFYKELSRLTETRPPRWHRWKNSAALTVKGLRLFAKQHFDRGDEVVKPHARVKSEREHLEMLAAAARPRRTRRAYDAWAAAYRRAPIFEPVRWILDTQYETVRIVEAEEEVIPYRNAA